jgi:hypothetical protein
MLPAIMYVLGSTPMAAPPAFLDHISATVLNHTDCARKLLCDVKERQIDVV